MSMKRWALLIAVFALVVAACDSDGEAEPTTEATAPPTTAAPDTTEAAPDTIRFDIFVMSAGPDEEVDTPFEIDGVVPGDDDLIRVVSGGSR